MKLILVENVEDLGKAGETVEVKIGYARNYLLPKNLALEVTASNLKIIEKNKKKQQIKSEKVKQQATELAKRVATVSCTITMPAGEDDKLFGAVTTQDIADSLKQENIIIDKKDIVIGEPIHKLGIYNVQVKLHPEVMQELKVWVIKK